ncbi:uncharacterized protein [Rutidosis leptorrhynchoides]|uniref:uncharacterized protein n=1 Tax=Rutidosis leptorrhynchoides TaxID=125765 RepID=UPI003A98FB51
MLTSEEAKNSYEVVSGTFMVTTNHVKVFFDCGTGMSFVSLKYAAKLNKSLANLDTPLEVEISDGRFSIAVGVYKNCDIVFGNENFKIDLIPITLGEFDVVINMDWLDRYKADIACHEKFVLVKAPSGG